MPKLFISYRRDDSRLIAPVVYDKVADAFGASKIFMDEQDVVRGRRLTEQIGTELQECHAMLVLIGKSWLSAEDDEGNSRLSQEDDWVRREVETGLGSGIPVIPGLIDGAPMPGADVLPESIADLADRGGSEIRGGRDQKRDLNDLVKDIRKATLPKSPGNVWLNRGLIFALVVAITWWILHFTYARLALAILWGGPLLTNWGPGLANLIGALPRRIAIMIEDGIFRYILTKRWVWILLLALGIALYGLARMFATIEIDATQTDGEVRVGVIEHGDYPGGLADLSMTTLSSEGGRKERFLVFTPWGKRPKWVVEAGGLPPATINVKGFHRERLVMPHAFRRPVLWLIPPKAVTNNNSPRPGLDFAIEINGEARGTAKLERGGVLVGAHSKVEILESQWEQWKSIQGEPQQSPVEIREDLALDLKPGQVVTLSLNYLGRQIMKFEPVEVPALEASVTS